MKRSLARAMAGVAFGLVVYSSPALAQIAVVVSKSNPVNDLSLEDLEDLYLGRRTTFASGELVVLGEYRPARRSFYQVVLRLSESAVNRHWIGIVFSEGQASPPRVFRDAEAAHRFVLSTRGAICFLDLAAVTDDMKVLTIGGNGPRDQAYSIR